MNWIMRSYAKFIYILLAVSLSSCFDDPGTDIVWDGDAYLEIDRAGQPNPVISMSFAKNPEGGTPTTTIDVQINIMGRPQAKDVVVNFTTDSSTAIAGVHYNLLSPKGSLTIPAGQVTANLKFEVLPDGFDPDNDPAPWQVVFTLTGGDLPLSEYSEVTYSLSGKCTFDLDFFTGAYDCNEPGYGDYTVNFTKDPDNENVIINDNFWDAGVSVKLVLDPDGETLVVADGQEFTYNVGRGPETLTVTGTGTLNSCTGEMIENYTVKTKADNLSVDANKHTYTK